MQKFHYDPFTNWRLPYLNDFQKKMVGLLEWTKEEKKRGQGYRVEKNENENSGK
jgi:hypothetical protein